jgi:putative endonuclease
VHLRAGEAAELLVVREVELKGFQIVGRRVRFGPLEADIIARDGDIVIVIEVRGRRASGWQRAIDSCSPTKLRALERLQKSVWARFADDRSVRVVRVDLVSIEWTPEGPRMHWTYGLV